MKEYLKALFKTVIKVYKAIIIILLYFGLRVPPLFLAMLFLNKWLLLGFVITLPISYAMFMVWVTQPKRR